MENTAQLRTSPQVGNETVIIGVLMLILALALAAGVMWWRNSLGLGPIFLHPGSAEAAQQLVRTALSDVTKVGEPAITGDRTVTLTASIAQEDCSVQLYSPEKHSNDYGWTIKRIDCPASSH